MICIVKVDKDRFVRYRCTNIQKFVEFLNCRYGGWRWFNVYSDKTRVQIGSYTPKKGYTSV